MSDLIRVSQSRLIETRASVASVASPVEFYQPKQALFPKWDADRFVKNGYLEQTYVFSCVDKKAGTLARVPYRVGLDPDNPTNFRKNAQLAQLLGTGGKPAPGWTPRMWWKYIFSQFCIMGKFACRIERNAFGQINALWPLQAQHLRPVPDTSSNPKNFFIGYIYGNKGAPGYAEFGLDDVLYCWEPSPDDPRQPLSVIEAAKLDISVAQLINQYDFALLNNNAVPSTIVTTEPFADNSMRQSFRQQFMAKFSGPNNSGKTMFLEADPDVSPDGTTGNNVAGKISVERLGLTAQEMQSPEKRVATINDICVAFKTPLSILGDSTRSKFTNMESDYRNWWADVELPLADYVCDLINVHLAPQMEGGRYRGWFDFSGIGALKEPPRFTGTEVVGLEAAGILDRDEARRELGFAPWDDVTHPEMKELVPKDPATTPVEISGPNANQATDPIGVDPGRNNYALTGADATRAIPTSLQKALRAAVEHSLTQQKKAVEQRANSRRNIGDLPWSAKDTEFWTTRFAQDITPILIALSEYRTVPENFATRMAVRVVDDSIDNLHGTESVSMAYSDIEQRSEAISQTIVKMLEEIPSEVLSVILEAISRGKLTPAQALEVIS